MIYKEKEIGGQIRGLVFSQGTNILARDMMKDYDDEARMAMGGYCVLYAALKVNCVVNKITCDFTFNDVIGWADKLSISDYADLIQANNEMNSFAVEPDPNQPELSEAEKKSTPESTEQTATDSPVN